MSVTENSLCLKVHDIFFMEAVRFRIHIASCREDFNDVWSMEACLQLTLHVVCSFGYIQVSLSLFWIPGVSVAILEHAVGIPHELALLCVDPLRIFAFFCFTGWDT